MIDQATFVKWQDWSKRDDAWRLFVPNDIRKMLGEISTLDREMKAVMKSVLHHFGPEGARKVANDALETREE